MKGTFSTPKYEEITQLEKNGIVKNGLDQVWVFTGLEPNFKPHYQIPCNSVRHQQGEPKMTLTKVDMHIWGRTDEKGKKALFYVGQCVSCGFCYFSKITDPMIN